MREYAEASAALLQAQEQSNSTDILRILHLADAAWWALENHLFEHRCGPLGQ